METGPPHLVVPLAAATLVAWLMALYAWRRRIAPTPPRPQRDPDPIAFVRLDDAVSTPTAARYEIVLPGGELLRIEGAVHAPSVAALLGVLRAERPC